MYYSPLPRHKIQWDNEGLCVDIGLTRLFIKGFDDQYDSQYNFKELGE